MTDSKADQTPTRPEHMRPPDSTNGTRTGLAARWLTLLFVKASKHRPFCHVLRRHGILSIFNICIKTDPRGNLGEAHAMEFVAKHTAIPVPKVYCAFVHKGSAYTVMSRIKGHVVRQGWLQRSQESRTKILEQLRGMLVELRAIPPPEGTVVSNVDGGPFFDPRLPNQKQWGPFSTVRAFHSALVNDIITDDSGGDIPIDDDHHERLSADLAELLRYYQREGSTNPSLVFTHGDLNSFNILVSGDKVVGIIDWETSGWFPSYWEYTCAKDELNAWNVFWINEVDHFLTPMPEELHMDRIRLKYFQF